MSARSAVRLLAGAALSSVVLAGAAGCGSSKTQNPATAPTVSLWVNATTQDYRQVAAGAKLALAESEGRAGTFRVNYAGRQVSSDPAAASMDALNNARTSLRDTQVSAVVTALRDEQARSAIQLLNSAGISTVVLGDAALKAQACDAGSDIYPSGHPTAVVVPQDAVPGSWRATFEERLGFAPTTSAYRAYLGVKSVLSSLSTAGVATDDSPPRLDRDVLAARLTSAHGGC